MSWNAKEQAQMRYVTEHLNEVLAVTHELEIRLDESTERVTVHGIGKKEALLTVNVGDDSPRGFLEDVMQGINSLYE